MDVVSVGRVHGSAKDGTNVKFVRLKIAVSLKAHAAPTLLLSCEPPTNTIDPSADMDIVL